MSDLLSGIVYLYYRKLIKKCFVGFLFLNNKHNQPVKFLRSLCVCMLVDMLFWCNVLSLTKIGNQKIDEGMVSYIY